MESKWFTNGYDDAVAFGHRSGHGTDTKLYVVGFEIDDEILSGAYKVKNLDAIGDALAIDQLNNFSPIVTSINGQRVKNRFSLMKKAVLIEWMKEYFIRESKELPDTTRLHTQLYANGEVWTLVIDFETSPKEQGFLSIGVCYLLITDAPVELKEGDTFPFWDGATQIGTCLLID